tara:strand:- start:351 stop:479 length:129 start_codon:yes stop_codon:yes gene_type:complete
MVDQVVEVEVVQVLQVQEDLVIHPLLVHHKEMMAEEALPQVE